MAQRSHLRLERRLVSSGAQLASHFRCAGALAPALPALLRLVPTFEPVIATRAVSGSSSWFGHGGFFAVNSSAALRICDFYAAHIEQPAEHLRSDWGDCPMNGWSRGLPLTSGNSAPI